MAHEEDESKPKHRTFVRQVLLGTCITISTGIVVAVAYFAVRELRHLYHSAQGEWWWSWPMLTIAVLLIIVVPSGIMLSLDEGKRAVARSEAIVSLQEAVQSLQTDLGKLREDVDELLRRVPRF